MKTFKRANRKLKLGIVANEFFDPQHGGIGGFGWAARQAAQLFNSNPEYGVEATFLHRTLKDGNPPISEIHGTRMMRLTGGRLSNLRRLRAEQFDLLLMIDYRPGYRFFAAALPGTPVIVWVRDPRTPEDVQKINSLRVPETEKRPKGIDKVNCTSLTKMVRASRLLGRRVIFATPAPGLEAKIPGAYGVTPLALFFLPNAICPYPGEVIKSPTPRVVFLGRLDPIKRPWVFAKLAEQFADVEFLFIGNSHFEGDGAWNPTNLPVNVSLMGQLDGLEKLQILSSAWALINTSIHEGLAVSFLEALACETPVISCQNSEDIVSRFGYYVGRWDGDGLDSLPHFSEALNRLLQDTATRTKLGKEGRAWVTKTHSSAGFLNSFRTLCSELKLE